MLVLVVIAILSCVVRRLSPVQNRRDQSDGASHWFVPVFRTEIDLTMPCSFERSCKWSEPISAVVPARIVETLQ